MKRIISFLVALAMMFSVAPMHIFAIAAQRTLEDAILDNTPIDLVYCYADLQDPDLHIKTLDVAIKKDFDNDELKYS